MNSDTQRLMLQQFLRSRRSVRRFRPDPVEAETIQRILETATCAPSAHNSQPWRFVVLQDAARRERLAAAMRQDFEQALHTDGLAASEIQERAERSYLRICQAPAAVLLCLTAEGLDEYPDALRQSLEYQMAVQGVALAGGTLLLAAHAEGLGGVWICAPLFTPHTVSQVLELPGDWEPQAFVLLGYDARSAMPGAESFPIKSRKGLDVVTLFR